MVFGSIYITVGILGSLGKAGEDYDGYYGWTILDKTQKPLIHRKRSPFLSMGKPVSIKKQAEGNSACLTVIFGFRPFHILRR